MATTAKRLGPTITRTWSMTVKQRQRLADETLDENDIAECIRLAGNAPAGATVVLTVVAASYVTAPSGRPLSPVVSRAAVNLLADALLDAETVDVLGAGEWAAVIADNLPAAFMVAQAKRDLPPPPPPGARGDWFGLKVTDSWGPHIATSASPDAA